MEVKNEPTSARADFHPVVTCHSCGRRVPLIPTEDPIVKIGYPWRYALHFPSLILRAYPSYCKAAGYAAPEHVWKAASWLEDPVARTAPGTPTTVSMADFY